MNAHPGFSHMPVATAFPARDRVSRCQSPVWVRLASWFVCAMLVPLAAAAAPPVGGLPVPPGPEEALAEVQPVAFESAPMQGPLPLTGQSLQDRPAAAVRSPLRPLGDWTVLLAIGAAFALVAAFRLTSLRRTKPLPPDVFELLGEASLGGQQAVRVVRFGPRTLLLGISSAGCQTLAMLDDPQTTERIANACRGDQSATRGVGRRPSPRSAAAGGGEAS